MEARAHGSVGDRARRAETAVRGHAAPPRPCPHTPGRSCVVIGLTGGIGSGKTTVAREFARLGAVVLDADAMCSKLHETPDVRAAIRERWGRAVFRDDGKVHRAKLAEAVFGNPAELAALNALLHPKVVERIKREVADLRRSGEPGLCVIDAPLLMESGLARVCDAIVFVDCDKAERARRLARDRGWAPGEMERREAHQQPLEQKRAVASFVIDNNADTTSVRRQIEKVVAQFKPNGV